MIIDMENNNTSTTTNEGLKEIDKQINHVMYGMEMPCMREGVFTFYIYVRLLRKQ